MKKIFVLAFICLFFRLEAQENLDEPGYGFNRNDMFITGSISFISIDNDSDGFATNERFGVGTSLGRFFTNNIAVGILAEFSVINNGERTYNNYSAGVFGRYYITPENRFSLFGEFNAIYFDNEGFEPALASYGYSLVISPGISYFLSNSFALQATFGQLGYNYNKRKNSDTNQSIFNFGLNLSNINFGLLYKF